MRNRVNYVRGSLLIALLMAGAGSFVCAVGYFGIPIQQIETRAELLKSQSSGVPISDADITTHLGRLASVRLAFGAAGAFIVVSCLAMIVALILLSFRDSCSAS